MPARRADRISLAATSVALLGCAGGASPSDDHSNHTEVSGLPASRAALNGRAVAARGAASPRRGEEAVIRTGSSDTVTAWIVYPDRITKAPVVMARAHLSPPYL